MAFSKSIATMSKVLFIFSSIFFISIIVIPITSFYFENSLNINYFQKTRYKLFNITQDLMRFTNDHNWFVALKNKLDNTSKGIAELPIYMYAKKKVPPPNSFFYENHLNQMLHRFFTYTDRIGGMFKHYKAYSESGLGDKTYHENVIKDFVSSVVSHRTGGLTDIMEQLYRLIVPSQINPHTYKPIRLGLLDLLFLRQKNSHPTEICRLENSFFHQINEIYAILCHVEILSYIMFVFAYVLLAEEYKVPFQTEVEKVAIASADRNEKYLNLTQKFLAEASREIIRCDPPEHVRDVTFVELTHLFQKFLINEVQAFPDETCAKSCYEISSDNIYRCYKWSPSSPTTMYCHTRGCKGKIEKCSWIGSSTICELPIDSPRRFQWIRSKNGLYGPKEPCQGNLMTVENSILGLYNCDNCMCHCTEDRPDATSIRFLSLIPQLSNISDNRVITGIRFVKKDHMIHIQIEEGQLVKEGEIKNKTFKWLELGDFVYKSDSSEGAFYKIEENNEMLLVEGKDYTMISSRQRTLFLDDITAPSNKLIIGVRLNHVEPQASPGANTSPLRLEILVTGYGYESGLLEGDEAQWLTSETMPYPSSYYERDRREVLLLRPDNPTKFYSNIPHQETNLLIKFRTTDIWKDAAQTVVPLFDIQRIISKVRPLDGIGITFKSIEDSGGFICFKLFTIDCANHLRYISEEDIENWKSFDHHT